MRSAYGAIPFVGRHRGVGLHADQSSERLEIVKAAIDRVLAMAGIGDLFEFAQNCANPPESRLLAAALVQARWDVAAAERRQRPDIDLDVLHASTAALGGRYWRSPWYYGSLLDIGPGEPVRRDVPLDEDRA